MVLGDIVVLVLVVATALYGSGWEIAGALMAAALCGFSVWRLPARPSD